MTQITPAGRPAPNNSSEPLAWIEIERGRTQFPRRPFRGERLLIGSGSNCDVQLGGHGIPILHSLIHRDGANLRAEAIVGSPPLIVAGRPVREAIVTGGDRIEIGRFAFRVQVNAAAAAWQDDLLAPIDVAAVLDHEERALGAQHPLQELSALQLAERIEAELRTLNHDALGQRLGLEALVRAALAVPAHEATDDPPALTGVIARLEQMAGQLAAQTQNLSDREQALTVQAEAILRLKERIEATGVEFHRGNDAVDGSLPNRLRISA
jgi:hypothetical protein